MIEAIAVAAGILGSYSSESHRPAQPPTDHPVSDLIGRLIGASLFVAPIGLIAWQVWPWK